MSIDVATYFAERIESLRGLDGGHRQIGSSPLERGVHRVLRDFNGHIWGWSNQACRAHGDRDLLFAEDVRSTISLKVWQAIMKELTDPADPAIVNYYSYFQKIAQRTAFAFFHTSERSGFSNVNGALRRTSKINKTRGEMTISMGREPSDEEVVAEVNRVMHETRKNPEKQGALVSLQDVRVATSSSLDGMVAEYGDSIWEPVVHDEAELSSVEAPSLIERIIDECFDESSELGEIAQLWIGNAVSEPPVIRTEVEIRDLVSPRVASVAALMIEVKEVAQRVCIDDFGIDSPFL
ncbi:hypothetical protein [Leifsonia sp. Leaf264]|uniref:hypothetical protein n=1 Tax=Leifsonia sp. Leaf264 TaxID=1736314 RepID=UPI0006FF349E|nr:hypothetical protein [Leifsonia sp. Leaf264]KQO98871.1 hypothetical protein ASF30_12475 [Leifsonia sp. Leaf264]